jgi:hypothetical protein
MEESLAAGQIGSKLVTGRRPVGFDLLMEKTRHGMSMRIDVAIGQTDCCREEADAEKAGPSGVVESGWR